MEQEQKTQEKDPWKKTEEELTEEDIKAIHEKASSGKAKVAQDGSYVFFGHDEYDITKASKKRMFIPLKGVTIFEYAQMVDFFEEYAIDQGANLLEDPQKVRNGVRLACDIELDPDEFKQAFKVHLEKPEIQEMKKQAGRDAYRQVKF